MRLNDIMGTYLNGTPVSLRGSFRVDGTNSPDVIRDGNSNCVLSVARVSAGLFTVTFDTGFPIPAKLVDWSVNLAQVAVPTQVCHAYYVVDSYSQITRSFQIKCVDYETPSAVDPDDNDMIAFNLVGSVNSAGSDAA